MQTINSKDAQNNFGSLMSRAIKEPVVINKHGKPAAVIMSYEDYENYAKFEDLYWEMKAEEARQEGFLTANESEELLDKIIKGQNV